MQQIMPSYNPRVPPWVPGIIFIAIPAFMSFVVGINNAFAISFFTIIFMTIIYWVGLRKIIIIIKTLKFQKIIIPEAKKKLIEFIGKTPKYIDVSMDCTENLQLTGTAIAYKDGHIYIMDKGNAIKIPWSDVRSWSWRADEQDGGFFVDIVSIEHPRWGFNCGDEKTLLRWKEIFNQLKSNDGYLSGERVPTS